MTIVFKQIRVYKSVIKSIYCDKCENNCSNDYVEINRENLEIEGENYKNTDLLHLCGSCYDKLFDLMFF